MLRVLLLAGLLLTCTTGCFYYDDDCHDGRRGRWDDGSRYGRGHHHHHYDRCEPSYGRHGRW